MTLLSRNGYLPTRRMLLLPSLSTSVKDINVVVPVLNKPSGVAQLLRGFQDMDARYQLPAKIIVVDYGFRVRYEQFDPQLPIRLLGCTQRSANARQRGAATAPTALCTATYAR